ncbi:signal recognition particle 9 kDa protein isoform X1 [Phyllobates terribilis]|uniref:signal recognition particle 9 kDa protein isoform X1 n=1 Tax=Phyllobates terribilis TaxID=111132 RepID=UPI003CCADD43
MSWIWTFQDDDQERLSSSVRTKPDDTNLITLEVTVGHKFPGAEEARVTLKYRHCDGTLRMKVTDDVVCLLYSTDQAQDVKKIEKFQSQLMRLMVARESRTSAMETN